MRVWLDWSEHILHRNMHLISHSRAHARRWAAYEAEHGRQRLLDKVQNQPDLQRRRDEIAHAENGIDEETIAFAAERVDDKLALMEKALSQTEWLVGDSFSLADMAVLPFIERLKVNKFGDRVDAKPHLVAWYERMFDRRGVKAAFAFAGPNAPG
ncbi:MAG: glutathione S-transferase family protein [Alphaproteobacteria bacterium]|nr:glutathione S-transferase family protein [Alphaproteobacteria bacterium]